MGDAEGPYSFAPLLAAALGLAVCVVLGTTRVTAGPDVSSEAPIRANPWGARGFSIRPP